jgi:hypothetical protein
MVAHLSRTANLYFKARNGTYKRVPQIANQFNDDDNAGLTVYYTSPGPNLTTAFRPVRLSSQWTRLVVTEVGTGLPHAHWRRNETHVRKPREEHATVLPLLHKRELRR